MRAAIYTNYGSANVLELREVDIPVPKDNEVLVKVFATTVNRTDCARLQAKPFIMRFTTGFLKPKNPIPGTDFAGKVEAVGKDVKSLKVGNDVFGFDDNGLGSQAQYMTFPEHKGIAKMPINLSHEQSVACLEGAHYAYNFINKVNLESGQRVLVNGATGAIGAAAVQLLKHAGAIVTAVCASENEDLVKSLGANFAQKRISPNPKKSKRSGNPIFTRFIKSAMVLFKSIKEGRYHDTRQITKRTIGRKAPFLETAY